MRRAAGKFFERAAQPELKSIPGFTGDFTCSAHFNQNRLFAHEDI